MNSEIKSAVTIDQGYQYAWGWFSYHAAQRLNAYRFFLIMIGVVIVGYLKCVEMHWPRFGVVVGLFGALIAVAFWLLEIRNEELVHCGRAALDKLEAQFLMTIRKDEKSRAFLEESLDPISKMLLPRRWRPTLVKYRFWLRSIYGVTLLGFMLTTAYACRGFRWFW